MVMGVMLLFSLPLMAQTGKEWDDVTVTQVNREVAHTLSIPYGSESDIENNLMEASPYFLSLNGVWKFKWVPDPSQKPIDFYVPSYDVSGWDDIEVPSVWQMYGIRSITLGQTIWESQDLSPYQNSVLQQQLCQNLLKADGMLYMKTSAGQISDWKK